MTEIKVLESLKKSIAPTKAFPLHEQYVPAVVAARGDKGDDAKADDDDESSEIPKKKKPKILRRERENVPPPKRSRRKRKNMLWKNVLKLNLLKRKPRMKTLMTTKAIGSMGKFGTCISIIIAARGVATRKHAKFGMTLWKKPNSCHLSHFLNSKREDFWVVKLL